jgi:hypothetical protein
MEFRITTAHVTPSQKPMVPQKQSNPRAQEMMSPISFKPIENPAHIKPTPYAAIASEDENAEENWAKKRRKSSQSNRVKR